MANASDRYFVLWLRNEIDVASREVAARQKSIDAIAAAEGWFKSGRRIIESIRLVAETCLPLADKAFAKASEQAGQSHYEMARHAVAGLFDALAGKIPLVVQTASHPPHDRLLQEVDSRLQQVRNDLESKSEIERARIEAAEEANAERNNREREEAAFDRFQKLPRWGLLSVLAWIATRDMARAYRASLPGITFDKVDRAITIDRAWAGAAEETLPHAQKGVDDAWEMALAPALSDGKLAGSGSRVYCANLTSHQHHETGLTFPTKEKPREADSLELSRRSSEPALAPKGSLIADKWIEWRDIAFATDDIFRLWPASAAEQGGGLSAIARLLSEKADAVETPNPEASEEAPVKRGRPLKFPWVDGFDEHLLKLFEHHGDFDSARDPDWYQESAVNMMLKWCEAKHWPALPSRTAMREHIQGVREGFLRNYGKSE